MRVWFLHGRWASASSKMEAKPMHPSIDSSVRLLIFLARTTNIAFLASKIVVWLGLLQKQAMTQKNDEIENCEINVSRQAARFVLLYLMLTFKNENCAAVAYALRCISIYFLVNFIDSNSVGCRRATARSTVNSDAVFWKILVAKSELFVVRKNTLFERNKSIFVFALWLVLVQKGE